MVHGADSGLLLTADCPVNVTGVNGDSVWCVEQIQAYFYTADSPTDVTGVNRDTVWCVEQIQAYF